MDPIRYRTVVEKVNQKKNFMKEKLKKSRKWRERKFLQMLQYIHLDTIFQKKRTSERKQKYVIIPEFLRESENGKNGKILRYSNENTSNKAKNGTRRAQIPRKPFFLDCVQMNKNAKQMTSKTVWEAKRGNIKHDEQFHCYSIV